LESLIRCWDEGYFFRKVGTDASSTRQTLMAGWPPKGMKMPAGGPAAAQGRRPTGFFRRAQGEEFSRQKANPHGRMAAQRHENAGRRAPSQTNWRLRSSSGCCGLSLVAPNQESTSSSTRAAFPAPNFRLILGLENAGLGQPELTTGEDLLQD